jgi:hypothetical protein
MPSSVCGSRFTTRGGPGSVAATAVTVPKPTAHTSQSFCVMTTSGCNARSSGSSSA